MVLSEELKAIAEEVETLKTIPAGPRRGAACGHPRRLIWDLLASLQDHVAAEEGDVRPRVKEVLDQLRKLQELLATLRCMDARSRESHFALTDYAALAAELEEQIATASRLSLTMLSEGLNAIAKEVEDLKLVPAGPRRGAACGLPRLHMWDLLASMQDHMAAKGAAARPRAKEVLDHCHRLQELLASLRALDISSRESQWALTDYAALTAELEEQSATASRLLLLEDDSLADATQPCESSLTQVECSPTQNGSTKVTIKDIDDFQAERPCGMSDDGVCSRGCTVGGCEFHPHAGLVW